MKLMKIYEEITSDKKYSTQEILKKLKKIGYNNFEVGEFGTPRFYTNIPGIAKVKIRTSMAVTMKLDKVFGSGNYDTDKFFVLIPWKGIDQ